MSDRAITWLASYPKSGNTWTRMLLANFIHNEDEPVDINNLRLEGSISSNRPKFDETVGLPSSDMTAGEIDTLRPRVYEIAAAEAAKSEDRLFVKVHDAYHDTPKGEPLFPAHVTHSAIYLLRNPLDVAVSYAFHSGHDKFDKIIKRMAKPKAVMAGRGSNQLRQLTFDWAGHVKSWTSPKPFPVKIVRYEDLLRDTIGVFSEMVAFIGLEGADDPARIEKAVRFASFDSLRSKEDESGFGEKHPGTKNFFRSGKERDWPNHLTQEQAEQICADQKDIMDRFGFSLDGAAPLEMEQLHD